METRHCNECGESWTDTGDYECPFCGNDNTSIEDEDNVPGIEPEPWAESVLSNDELDNPPLF